MVADKVDYRALDDFISAIMEKAPSLLGEAIVADHIVCTQDLMRQIALTDIVICSRYHNAVYALKLGKPVISVGYSPKHGALLEAAGLGGYSQAADQLDVGLLHAQLVDVIKNRRVHEQSIHEANARFQELRNQQELILSSRFLGRGRVK